MTGWIDQGLNEKAYIIPGLGDFGERRFAIHPSRFSNYNLTVVGDIDIARDTSSTCVLVLLFRISLDFHVVGVYKLMLFKARVSCACDIQL